MKLSFSTLGCPEWDLDQIAANAADMGYDGVELRGIAGEHIGPEETPKEYDRVRKLFEKSGVEIACVMGYSRFTWDDSSKREADVVVARQWIDAAGRLGCPTLRIFGGVWEGIEQGEALDRVANSIKEFIKSAEDKGVAVALETHDDWCEGATLAEVVERVDSPAFGICWDVANSFLKEPMETTYSHIADHIHHVHFKDVSTEDEKTKGKLPGEGDVDLRGALRLLRDGGYSGFLSFEWEKKWEADLDEPEVAFPHYIKFIRQMMKQEGMVATSSAIGLRTGLR